MAPLQDSASLLFDELVNAARAPGERWARVERLCADGEEESLHLDFKEVTIATDPARDPFIIEKLARALSGFANQAGGLLVYGIKTSGAPKGQPDRAQSVTRIWDVARFRASLEKLASSVVEPVVGGIDIRETEDPAMPGAGIVAVLVPESFGGPHRAVRTTKDASEKYFMRTTTEIIVMPHASLADRFARVARPAMRLAASLSGAPSNLGLNVKLRNVGRGVAAQPAIRFTQIDNSLEWRRITALNFGWRIDWPKGAPTPNQVVYASEPGIVVYPTVDVVAIHVPAHGSLTRIHVEGEIFCREAQSVPFSGDVFESETVLPHDRGDRELNRLGTQSCRVKPREAHSRVAASGSRA